MKRGNGEKGPPPSSDATDGIGNFLARAFRRRSSSSSSPSRSPSPEPQPGGSQEFGAKGDNGSDDYPEGPGLVCVFSQSGGKHGKYDGGDLREGNIADINAINETFREFLGYTVKHYANFLGEQIRGCFQDIREELRKEDYYSVTLILMGHGGKTKNGEEYLSDVNSGPVSIRNAFIKRVRNSKLPTRFRGRPRIVFIQACRGSSRQRQVMKSRRDYPSSSSLGPPEGKRGRTGGNTPGVATVQGKRLTTATATVKRKTPSSSSSSPPPPMPMPMPPPPQIVADDGDLFMMYSTVESNVSYRNDDTGSYFIQALCGAIQKNPYLNMNALHKEVKEKMEEESQREYFRKAGVVMLPEVQKTMVKDFCYKRFPDPPAAPPPSQHGLVQDEGEEEPLGEPHQGELGGTVILEEEVWGAIGYDEDEEEEEEEEQMEH